MAIVTIDFETFYAQGYSLRNKSEVEYVLSPDFQTILCGIKVGDRPVFVTTGENETRRAFAQIDWQNTALLAHNTRFDGAILAWRYGIRPRLYLDTMSMARALTHAYTGSSSLDAVARHLGLPAKGTAVVRAMGLRLEDFSPEQLAEYRDYCAHDTGLCRAIFDRFMADYDFPRSELKLIDLALRMFLLPQAKLDANKLAAHLAQVRTEKAQALAQLEYMDKGVFSSNERFAQLLRAHGVEVPLKVSAQTGEVTYALAKNDRAFKELCADETLPPAVQAMLQVRLGEKSTIEETRSAKLLDLARQDWRHALFAGLHLGNGSMPVPYRYYGAHTGRFSGDGGFNFANLRRGSPIRDAICAPEGWRIVHRDSSQIEARMVAHLAGCEKLLAAFREGRDVYSEFASRFYRRTITRADVKERFIGKTCLAAGTRVLTDRGWFPIEMVQKHHKLWDGVEWVSHDGLIANGQRETLSLCGISLTPDHLVWCGTHWQDAKRVRESNGRSLKLALAAANLPSLVTFSGVSEVFRRLWSDALVAHPSMWSIAPTSECSVARAAMSALRRLLAKNVGGNITRRCQTRNTVEGFLVDWLQRLHDAMFPQLIDTSIMACAGSASILNGAPIKPASSATSKPSQGGMIPVWTWIGLKQTETTSQVTCVLSPGHRTASTGAKSPTWKPACENWKPVYDLANAGPRHRFTVLTNDGPLIVSNCVLALGYACGHEKFRHALFIGQGGVSVDLELQEASRLVFFYRDEYAEIPALWRRAQAVIDSMLTPPATPVEPAPLPVVVREGDTIGLPNGLGIIYPNMRREWDTTNNAMQVYYDGPYGRKRIYGGKMIENITQALARIVVTDVMIRVSCATGQHPVMSTYDSLDYCVREGEAEDFNRLLEREFAVAPPWASDLPLASEGGFGQTLLEAEQGVNR
jgi:hypothetical protein